MNNNNKQEASGMNDYATHKDLDDTRRELHGDHATLMASMDDKFGTVFANQADASVRHTSSLRWYIGVIITVLAVLLGYISSASAKIEAALTVHLQHSAALTEKSRHNESAIKTVGIRVESVDAEIGDHINSHNDREWHIQ